MKKTIFILMCGGLFIVSALYVPVGAQVPAGKSTNDGVYTDAQAKRGDVLYKEQCATCHGDNLEGSGPMPPLAGKDFLVNWQGKTVRSEEHTSELQSQSNLVCRLLLEKKNITLTPPAIW